ncbi:MAG TPA: hypothetical protein VGI80_03130, partial [Pyrinomonadaceae bacterium]
MKVLFLFLSFALLTSYASAQIAPLPVPEMTNIEELSSRSGALVQREFSRVGEFATLRVDIVKVTDLSLTKASIFGVRISGNVAQGASRDSAFIDANEIDEFVKMIDLMRTTAFSTTPDNFTDLVYRSRGGISLGAIYANKRWSAAVRLDRFDPKTAVNVDATDID